MSNKLYFAALAGVLLAAPTAIQAQDVKARDFKISGSVTLASQYSFRGIDQSDEAPALQAGFDLGHTSGLYAGIWASNVDFDDGDEASLETDIYAGYSASYTDINYDIGVIHYAYPGADDALDYDYTEASIALGYDFDLASVSAALNYSPDYFGDSGDAYYYVLSGNIPLPRNFAMTAHIGHQDIEDNAAFGTPDYTDWSAGINYSVKSYELSLKYVDSDLDQPSDCADGCDARGIVSLTRSF